MSDLERRPPQPLDLVRELSVEGQRLLRRKRRRMQRILKGVLLMALAPFVIISGVIAAGVWGSHWLEVLVTAPLLIFSVWGALVYWTFFKKLAPEPAPSAEVKLLPATTEDWLEEQRALLPRDAQRHADSISRQLAALAPQLEGVDPQA